MPVGDEVLQRSGRLLAEYLKEKCALVIANALARSTLWRRTKRVVSRVVVLFFPPILPVMSSRFLVIYNPYGT